MDKQKTIIIAAVIIAAAIILAPIALHSYKFNQCMKSMPLHSNCVKHT